MISFEKRCSEIYDSLTNMEVGLKLGKVHPKEVAARLPVAGQMVGFMESTFAEMAVAQMKAQSSVDSYFEEKNAPNR